MTIVYVMLVWTQSYLSPGRKGFFSTKPCRWYLMAVREWEGVQLYPEYAIYSRRSGTLVRWNHRRRIRQKRRRRSSLLVEGRNWFNSIPNKRFSTRMIWRKGWIEELTLGGMKASEKWMIIRFTSHQTTALSKWMYFPKFFFKSSLQLNGQSDIQVWLPNSRDDLCLLFCPILHLWLENYAFSF